MKLYTVYTERKNGDTFNTYHLDKDEAIYTAKKDWEHLTKREQERCRVYVEGYEFTINEPYTVTTADKLMQDLFNGDVTSDEYDELTGFVDKASIYFEKIGG